MSLKYHKPQTPHDHRATARDWFREARKWRNELAVARKNGGAQDDIERFKKQEEHCREQANFALEKARAKSLEKRARSR